MYPRVPSGEDGIGGGEEREEGWVYDSLAGQNGE